jgi:Nucleotide-sugar transporter
MGYSMNVINMKRIILGIVTMAMVTFQFIRIDLADVMPDITTMTFRRTTDLLPGDQIETTTAAASISSMSMSQMWGLLSFVLLAIQCGVQPLLIKKYIPTTIDRTSIVFAQETVKLLMSLCLFTMNNTSWYDTLRSSWTLHDALVAAGVPSFIFVIQGYCNLLANQTLPPITFVLLNQTKMISTAWFCFVLLGQGQSPLQVMSLLLVVLATIFVQNESVCNSSVSSSAKSKSRKSLKNYHDDDDRSVGTKKTISTDEYISDEEEEAAAKGKIVDSDEEMNDYADEDGGGGGDNDEEEHEASHQLLKGVLPALLASLLSGLAAALTQRTLQTDARDPFLFNIELSVVSSMILIMKFLVTRARQQNSTTTTAVAEVKDVSTSSRGDIATLESSCMSGWKWTTIIPIVSNACGAILVGLVTKYSGAVLKGFANVAGIVISGVLQYLYLSGQDGEGGGTIRTGQLIGGAFVITALVVHLTNPPTNI